MQIHVHGTLYSYVYIRREKDNPDKQDTRYRPDKLEAYDT